MNLLIIWLIVSVISTGLVLLSIRFAPTWDDEPLHSHGERWLRIDEDHDQPMSLEQPTRRKHSKMDRNVKIIRSDARAEMPPVHSSETSKTNEKASSKPPLIRLGRFAIIRSEEPQA